MYTLRTVSLLIVVVACTVKAASPTSCPGYTAKNVRKTSSTLTADLELAGKACNIYGADILELRLEVTYDDGMFPTVSTDPLDSVKHQANRLHKLVTPDSRIHVKILDPKNERYEVPEDIFPRPAGGGGQSSRSHIRFDIQESPFSFKIVRKSNGENLFDTTGHPLIFENQYLRLKTNLPRKANIYGLGEHTRALRLDTVNTTRTMWARDAPGIPKDSNLYGVHPIYLEHRNSGSHGVFLLNSNGMDIKIRGANITSLEYNVIGGIFDLYFFAGPTPADVSRQYARVAGVPAMTPYWNLGVSR